MGCANSTLSPEGAAARDRRLRRVLILAAEDSPVAPQLEGRCSVDGASVRALPRLRLDDCGADVFPSAPFTPTKCHRHVPDEAPLTKPTLCALDFLVAVESSVKFAADADSHGVSLVEGWLSTVSPPSSCDVDEVPEPGPFDCPMLLPGVPVE